jgi:hypothetical protein
MYLYYFAEYAYGHNAGPFTHFALDFNWYGQNTRFGCNESVWLVPGTVQS